MTSIDFRPRTFLSILSMVVISFSSLLITSCDNSNSESEEKRNMKNEVKADLEASKEATKKDYEGQMEGVVKIYRDSIQSLKDQLEKLNVPYNVAFGKKTKQSSNYDESVGAEKAVDGNTCGHLGYFPSTTHTKNENTPWWQVDLGEVYDISEIKIWNRWNKWERLKGFYIIVSENKIGESNKSDAIGRYSFNSVDERSLIIPNLNARGRYLRIFIPGKSKILSLAEVEVLAVPTTQ